MLHLREVGRRWGHWPGWAVAGQPCPEVHPQGRPPSWSPSAPRRGEGAFRLRPRVPMPPRPLDKYELRETKQRLLQGLDGARRDRLHPRSCTHLALLGRDHFCGERGPGGRAGGSSPPLHPCPTSTLILGPPPHKTAWVSTTVPASPHRACGGAASAGTARLPEALLTLPLLSPPWPPQPPTSPCVPCPAAPALTPHRSGSSGCPSPSPSSVSVPEGADAPSRDGPWRPPFFVLPASPCTGGEAVAPAAAYEQRPWWPWVRSTVPTGPLSKTGTGPGTTGCLSWCVWT